MEDGGHLLELLETLEAGVLSLDRGVVGDSAASIHRLFQSAHNLKSGLAMAGLTRASQRFHTLEDGLDDIRRGRLAWSSAWADAVLDTVDRVKACLELGHDEGLEVSIVLPHGGEGEKAPAALSPEEAEAAIQASAQGRHLYRIEKLFGPGLTRDDFEGHLIYEDIGACGTLVSVKPGWEDYRQATSDTVVKFLFSSSSSHEKLSELFFDPLIQLPVPPPRFRILLVDDDPTILQVVRRAIEPLGEITTAGDGGRGTEEFRLALVHKRPFDVVILDLAMPELDGHEALQSMRELEESRGIHGLDRCLVFINTSSRDYDKVRFSFRFQADRYFIKPLSVNAIKKKLEESLPWLEDRRRATQ